MNRVTNKAIIEDVLRKFNSDLDHHRFINIERIKFIDSWIIDSWEDLKEQNGSLAVNSVKSRVVTSLSDQRIEKIKNLLLQRL